MDVSGIDLDGPACVGLGGLEVPEAEHDAAGPVLEVGVVAVVGQCRLKHAGQRAEEILVGIAGGQGEKGVDEVGLGLDVGGELADMRIGGGGPEVPRRADDGGGAVLGGGAGGDSQLECRGGVVGAKLPRPLKRPDGLEHVAGPRGRQRQVVVRLGARRVGPDGPGEAVGRLVEPLLGGVEQAELHEQPGAPAEAADGLAEGQEGLFPPAALPLGLGQLAPRFGVLAVVRYGPVQRVGAAVEVARAGVDAAEIFGEVRAAPDASDGVAEVFFGLGELPALKGFYAQAAVGQALVVLPQASGQVAAVTHGAEQFHRLTGLAAAIQPQAPAVTVGVLCSSLHTTAHRAVPPSFLIGRKPAAMKQPPGIPPPRGASFSPAGEPPAPSPPLTIGVPTGRIELRRV